MTKDGDRLGVWLVGAAGNVATTVAVGLAAIRRKLTKPIGILTESEICRKLPLAPLSDIVLGGHEIARRTPWQTAEELQDCSNLFDARLLKEVRPELEKYSKSICRGVSIANAASIARCRKDLKAFRRRNRVQRVVVINLASTEPRGSVGKWRHWSELERAIQSSRKLNLPISTIYAIAAIEEGIPYINFTPSKGADHPAVLERANQSNVPIMGADGKTGETLVRTVLAPMFESRRLQVMSWVGTNILGNRDGEALRDAKSRAAKLHGKNKVLDQLLSSRPETKTDIEFVQSMHDWKTAWDHIHFRGFLDTKMTMQFTWQGCDSALAAPLVIDLARLADLHARTNRGGLMTQLSCFFKSPMGGGSQGFHAQMQTLKRYLDDMRSERRR